MHFYPWIRLVPTHLQYIFNPRHHWHSKINIQQQNATARYMRAIYKDRLETYGSKTSWSQSSICSSATISSSSSSGTERSRQSAVWTTSMASACILPDGRNDCVIPAYEDELVMKLGADAGDDMTGDDSVMSALYTGRASEDSVVIVDRVLGSSLETMASRSDDVGSSGSVESDTAATQLLDIWLTASVFTGVTMASGTATALLSAHSARSVINQQTTSYLILQHRCFEIKENFVAIGKMEMSKARCVIVTMIWIVCVNRGRKTWSQQSTSRLQTILWHHMVAHIVNDGIAHKQ